jgi:excinuclease ABC subunit A
MNFLPDLEVKCETCQGRRFNAATLTVLYKGKSIADILDLTIEEASEFFQNIPMIAPMLDCMNRVGLGYLTLGQSGNTLSGGEAQRLKLATELGRPRQGHTLYILDEPTTGLHFDDIRKLIDVLDNLVEKDNSVIVIEHNLDVMKVADYIIDLGPDGGANGGTVVTTGSPEEVAKCETSFTGQYLRALLSTKTA